MTTVHVPILLGPIRDALLEPFRNLSLSEPVCTLVDCTLGGGGHTAAILGALESDPDLRRHRVLAFDQDEQAIRRGHERFAQELREGRLTLVHGRFSSLTSQVSGENVLGILADLGFSSDQIEDSERGLSFRSDGPLDMRLDPSRGTSALDFLRNADERELADILFEYGEERFSRRIAARVMEARQRGELPTTTRAFAELITQAVPPPARHGRIHPATRSFQAIRILVNQELEELDSLLTHGILSLRPKGRVAILSFHSLEDRKVKQVFKDRHSGFRQLTKKPIVADEDEISRNPRSRSAKLRIAERLG